MKCLQLFMQDSPAKYAVRFWNKFESVDTIVLPSGKSFLLFNLPLYYAGYIEEKIKSLIKN